MTKIKTLDGFNRNQEFYIKIVHTDQLINLKKYDDAITQIGPSIDRHARPVTGLTEDIVEPQPGNKPDKVIQGTRTQMEQMMDLAPGALKPNSPFWVTHRYRMGVHPQLLDLREDIDLLNWLWLSAQSNVAVGMKEVQSSSKIEFVIYSEEQEYAQKTSGRKILKKAWVLSEKLDIETKVAILNTYGLIVDATKISTIEGKLDEKIEEDPAKFVKIAEDSYLLQKALVVKCLDKGILHRQGEAVLHGEVQVGFSKQDAAREVAENKALASLLKAKLSGDQAAVKKLQQAEKVK